MVLSNEFTVKAGIEDVWRHLLDMEGVAGCLPGATIEASDQEDVYKGSMKVRIGPMTVDYKGTAELVEVDEETHTARMSLRAKAKKGQGTAMATVTNRLEPVEGGTRVMAETDLEISGPQAQFGRGVMEDVGGRVLAEFARRLEEQITGGPDAAGAATGAESTGASSASGSRPSNDDDVLDLGSMVSQSMVGRYAQVAGAVLAILVVLIVLRRVTR